MATLDMAPSQVHMTADQHGLARLAQPAAASLTSLPIINRLLQKNHDEYNIFFRPVGGHNHTVHALLTLYAMGGTAEDFERAFADNNHQQAPITPIDPAIVAAMKDPAVFLKHLEDASHYANFLRFFEQEIEAHGWQKVVLDYCFQPTPVAKAMFLKLFEGLYHPLIHLGFGIEFDQPAIVAEGLAQAASHAWGNIDKFAARCEELAGGAASTPLRDLYAQTRATDKIRTAAKMQQGPNRVKDGVMVEATEELAALAAQFKVQPSAIDASLLETTSCAAYATAAAQRKGKAAKLDFFLMHTVTSSIFIKLLVQQPWVAPEYKAKIIEHKGRLDLVWYASVSAPALDLAAVADYQPTVSQEKSWLDLYGMICKAHDDGHVAKFVRALYSAEQDDKALGEGGERFPIQGGLWLKAAQMCVDSTWDFDIGEKWLMGTGFDPMWAKVADA